MKKTFTTLMALILCVCMFCSLIGCVKDEYDENDYDENESSENESNGNKDFGYKINGIDAAKLLLANERLNSQLFKNSDSILLSGEKVFNDLYLLAEENMVKYSGSVQTLSASKNEIVIQSLSSSSPSGVYLLSAENHTLANGSVLEVDGNIYRWSNFGEYSNSYDYFLNITTGVKSSAETGAKLIDDTKKYIRIVDTWVNVGGDEYYLHVDDNAETIYRRSEDQIEICRRYKREDGTNVYEISTKNTLGGSSRMVYIPGEKYEYSYIVDSFNHNFLAENNKGFWEIVDVGQHPEGGYNVSCMVLKNDICYDSIYNPESGEISILKVMSSDKKTDIMDIYFIPGTDATASITLNLQAFQGVKYVEQITDNIVILGDEESIYDNYVYRYDVPQNPEQAEHTVYFSGSDICTAVLENGLSVKKDDSFLDGRVTVNGITTDHVSIEGDQDGYIATMSLTVSGETYDDVIDTLEAFFADIGIVCTRDFDAVRAGILQAYAELAQMTKYHYWNESPIVSTETLNIGYENNLKQHKVFDDMYDAVKDAEVIDFEDKETVELNIKFAPITGQTSSAVINNGLSVSVSDFSLSVEDTTLFVEGEKYTVNFAVIETSATSNSGLIHTETENALFGEYKGEDTFTVTQTASFELPVLNEGNYTVVAYLSTEDGIRSSGYQAVAFTEVNSYEKDHENVNISISQASTGELAISVTPISDIEVEIEDATQTTYSYKDMFSALEEQAYLYGFVYEGTVIETSSDGDSWVALSGDETSLEDGIYRLKYVIKNGDDETSGYVYVNYSTQIEGNE